MDPEKLHRVQAALQSFVYLPALKEKPEVNGHDGAATRTSDKKQFDEPSFRPWDRQDLYARLRTFKAGFSAPNCQVIAIEWRQSPCMAIHTKCWPTFDTDALSSAGQHLVLQTRGHQCNTMCSERLGQCFDRHASVHSQFSPSICCYHVLTSLPALNDLMAQYRGQIYSL